MGYTVRPGDNWSKIAREQMGGDERQFANLMKANPGVFMLHPGQVLDIPEAAKSPVVTQQDIDRGNYGSQAAGWDGSSYGSWMSHPSSVPADAWSNDHYVRTLHQVVEQTTPPTSYQDFLNKLSVHDQIDNLASIAKQQQPSTSTAGQAPKLAPVATQPDDLLKGEAEIYGGARQAAQVQQAKSWLAAVTRAQGQDPYKGLADQQNPSVFELSPLNNKNKRVVSAWSLPAAKRPTFMQGVSDTYQASWAATMGAMNDYLNAHGLGMLTPGHLMGLLDANAEGISAVSQYQQVNQELSQFGEIRPLTPWWVLFPRGQ